MEINDDNSPKGWSDHIGRFAADLAGCLRFFSRIPVRELGSYDDPSQLPDFSRAARALGFAGIIISLPAGLLLFLLGLTSLPDLMIAAVALAALVLTTGAFHEDGLADMADGFGGGFERQRKLDIMKDSRIGSYGSVALILCFAARLAAITAVLDGWSAWAAALAFVAAGPMSRSAALWIWYALPAIRPDGASQAAGRPGRMALYASVLTAIVCVLGLVTPFFGLVSSFLAIVLPFCAVAGLSALAMRQVGGQTGDVLGAGQQVAEVAFYAGLLIWI